MCNQTLSYLGIAFLIILAFTSFILLIYLLVSFIQDKINERNDKILQWITEEETRNKKLDDLGKEPSPTDDYEKTKRKFKILENCLENINIRLLLLEQKKKKSE